MISQELLQILRCPLDRATLRYDAQQNTLTCTACGKVYRVKDDIPIMLPDDESTAS